MPSVKQDTIKASELVEGNLYRFKVNRTHKKTEYGKYFAQPSQCMGEGWPVLRTKLSAIGHTDTPIKTNDVFVLVDGDFRKVVT